MVEPRTPGGERDPATACVITGVGLITPVGEDPITRFDSSGCRCRIGAEVKRVSALPSTGDTPLSRGVALLATAATRALRDAGRVNYSQRDLECDLDYVPRVPRRKRLRIVLCDSFGLGGQYVSVLVGGADA